ncbi:MAG TPA: peptidase E [Patescibacteria group bacterium]|nr:peptidase E [Patescibacteria group bacterium]
MESKRQIIALGGGGFSMEPDNPALDQYILAQSPKSNPRVCFIPTASGDAQSYTENFYAAFNKLSCQPSHLSLFRGHTADIEDFVQSQDILYVGGGNTRNMLVLWHEWGLDKIIRIAYEHGIIMCGISAGAICWFEEGLTDSVPNELNRLQCLGFLKGSASPHFDGEAERRPAFTSKIASGEMLPGIGIDDSCAVHYLNEERFKIVASRESAQAYEFLKAGETLKEIALHAEFLKE